MSRASIDDDFLTQYTTCPLRVKHTKGQSSPTTADVFALVGSKILSHVNLSGGIPPYSLVTEWFSAAWKTIFGTTADKRRKRWHNTSLITVLPSFYEWYKDLKFVPVANNVVVSYEHAGIRYSTTVPHLIYLPVRKKLLPIFYYEMVVGTPNIYILRDMGIRMGISLAKELFKEYKVSDATIMFIGRTGKGIDTFDIGPIDDTFTRRTWEMMDAILENVSAGRFYPNTGFCRHCEFNGVCIP